MRNQLVNQKRIVQLKPRCTYGVNKPQKKKTGFVSVKPNEGKRGPNEVCVRSRMRIEYFGSQLRVYILPVSELGCRFSASMTSTSNRPHTLPSFCSKGLRVKTRVV